MWAAQAQTCGLVALELMGKANPGKAQPLSLLTVARRVSRQGDSASMGCLGISPPHAFFTRLSGYILSSLGAPCGTVPAVGLFLQLFQFLRSLGNAFSLTVTS